MLRAVLGALLLGGGLTAVLGPDPALAAGSAPHFAALAEHLTTERGDAVAASLPGGQVLIAGGQNNGGLLSSAELFDPASDAFTRLEGAGREMIEARQGAVAAALPDGDVLIAGGSNRSGYLSSAELFDPSTDTFTKLEGAGREMVEGREHPLAAVLPDGQVLIAGGSVEIGVGPFRFPEDVATAELFDPVTDTFAKLEGAGHEMTIARWGALAATLHDGDVLIAGGRYQNSAELFDPTTDTFTKLENAGGSLTVERQGAAAATLPDGQVLIAGGLSGVENLSSAELFDPDTDTFTKLEGPGTNLSEANEFAVTASLPDGGVLIAGGVNSEAWLSGADVFLPAAEASVVGADFGDQTVGESRASTVVVTNLGAQDLSISGVSIEGPDRADWTVGGDGCTRRTLSFGQSCALSLLFTPSHEGTLEATLKLSDNEPSQASVTPLTGTGVPAEHGPGGPEGKTGASGPTGARGERGAAGATGPRGPAGAIELVVCAGAKAKNGKLLQRCEVKPGASPFKLTGRGRKLAVSLRRAGRLYAKGFALLASDGKTQLLLEPLHRLPSGRYTLTVENKHRQTHETVTIAGRLEHTKGR
jgi:hypothetical protein